MNIGGMQTTDDATYAPLRIDEPPGMTRTCSLAAKWRVGKSIFVDERENAWVAALGQLADAETEQNALFYPGVGLPPAADLFGGAYLAGGERIAEAKERFAGSGFLRRCRAERIQPLNFPLEFVHGGQYNWSSMASAVSLDPRPPSRIEVHMSWIDELLGRTLVLVAHPDDECLAFGALLQRMREPLVVFATNGSPADPYFWQNHGSREAYAALRREEALKSMHAAGVKDVVFLA